MREIFERYSPRAFDKNRFISKEIINEIIKAASKAPSSFNNQPWNFFVANRFDNKNFFDLILSTLTEFNQKWACNASILLAMTCKNKYDHNGNVNINAPFELGLAVSNMITKAMSLDIYSHLMGGFDSIKLKKLLNLNENFDYVIVMAMGYLGNIEELPDDIKEVELKKVHIRKSIEEIMFTKPL